MTYDVFAQRYGWTPAEVDDMPQVLIEELPLVWAAQGQAAARRRMRAGMVEQARAMVR